MDVPANTLADRRADAERRLAELREQRGAAALADEAFDDSLIAAAEQELSRLADAASVAAARQPGEDRRNLRAAYDQHLADFDAAADRRVAAVTRAESASRELVAAVREALTAAAATHAAAHAMHELIRGNGAYFSPMLAGPISVGGLEVGLLTAFRGLIAAALGRWNFANVDFSNATGDPPSTSSWAMLEQARVAPVRKYFVAEAPSADREAA